MGDESLPDTRLHCHTQETVGAGDVKCDDFIKQVREKVTEGTSALFALTSGATAPDKIIDELRQYDFELISTNLPEEQENKLREVGLAGGWLVG